MFDHCTATPDAAHIAEPRSSSSPQRTDGARALAAKPRWASAQLLGGHQEVEIEHQGAIYRLRRTALGKLIITK